MGKKSTDVAVSLSMVIRMPSSGINQGAKTLLNYKYGSKNYDRVMQTDKTLLRFQFLFFAPMTTLLELFPEVFLRIFTSDPAVIKEESWMVRLYAACFFVIPIQTVFQQITLSTDQEKDCLYMVIIRKLVLHIPLLFILPMFMTNKVLAVVLSVPISDILSVVVTVACFVPGFCQKMNNYVNATLLNISKSTSPDLSSIINTPFLLYSIPFSTSTMSIRFILRENRKLTSTETVITNIAAIIYVDGEI